MKEYLHIYFVLPFFIVLGVIAFQYDQYGDLPEVLGIEPPNLPVSPMGLSKSSLEDALSNNLWDKNRGHVMSKAVKVSKDKAVSALQWHLVAIAGGIGTGSVAMVEVIVDGEKSWRTYFSGDLLPDASRVLEVLNDGMVVENNGEQRNVYLFGKKNE